MIRYRARAVLLLFGVLYLTACTSWQPAATPSPTQFVEVEQPDRVRVTVRDGTELVLDEPSVEGDELLGTVEEASVRVPFGDIFRLEVRRFSVGRTVMWVAVGVGAYVAVFWVVMTLASSELEDGN